MSFSELNTSIPERRPFSVRLAKPLCFFLLILLPFSLCGLVLRGCANAHSRPIGQGDMTFDVSSSGDAVVFNGAGTGERDLYLLRLSDLYVTRVADTSEYEVAPSFSPDGKSIVYAAGVPGDRADHIFVRSLDGAAAKQLTRADANDSSPRVSPDGSLVAFARDKTYAWGGLGSNWSDGGVICVITMDGRNERQITPDDAFAYAPWFLPDGESLAYWTESGIFSVPTDGSAPPRKLMELRGTNVVAPSRDGKFVAYKRGRYEGDQELLIANSDGSGERPITPTKAAYYRPVFSPDGDQMYFLLAEWPDGPTGTPRHSLWRINIDGTNLRKVASSQLFEEPLKWKPESPHD
jgi:Tol biopolymer transport system component